MKSNNIPRSQRIQNHIDILKYKLNTEYSSKPYGKGNHYYYCSSCNRSMVEVSYDGHYKGCKIPGIKKEIEYYERLLNGKK
jgi:hypothetical protein